MRVALTGATGFIGSVIARQLNAAGHLVTAMLRPESRSDHVLPHVDRCIEGSIEQRSAFPLLLEEADVLVHSALDWHSLETGDLPTFLDSNLTAGIELLETAARSRQRIILLSSVAVHHQMSDRWAGRIDAEHPVRPGTLYGAMKASLEAHLWALNAMHDVQFVSFRPAAVYGIDPNLERSIGAPILRSIADGEPYTRTGGGKFVHVDDVASAVLASLELPAGNPGIYHLADCYARWADWASMACEVLGTDVPIDDRSPTASRNMFCNEQLHSDLGIELDRGHGGIRTHLAALQDAIENSSTRTES